MDGNKFSYEWIETLPRLEGVARILGQAKIIGVDLEADSFYHYFEKVCLIQIATESASYVIDPLALRDLSALHPVFSNPRIRKVFHGADYDIRLCTGTFGLRSRTSSIHSWPLNFWASGRAAWKHCCEVGSMWS